MQMKVATDLQRIFLRIRQEYRWPNCLKSNCVKRSGSTEYDRSEITCVGANWTGTTATSLRPMQLLFSPLDFGGVPDVNLIPANRTLFPP